MDLDNVNPIFIIDSLNNDVNKFPACKGDSCLVVSADVFNILNAKFDSPSNVDSIIDTTSTRSEKDATKSTYSLEKKQIQINGISVDNKEVVEEGIYDDFKEHKDMTLCDIISKSTRIDTIKNVKCLIFSCLIHILE